MTEGKGRNSYLLNGRRVRVSDLLDAGLLHDGQSLRFARTRSGETHTAHVDRSGGIVVDGHSHSHSSPSAAAHAAAGLGAFDGWTAWATDAGTSLHGLRLQLLDAVASDTGVTGSEDDDGADESAAIVPRHEFLKNSLASARNGSPERLTVRDLLGRWQVLARGWRASNRISADLENHGLRTEPDFLSVSLDDVVSLMEDVSGPAHDGEAGIDDRDAPTDDHGSGATRPEIGLTLGNVVDQRRPLVWVKPTATIEEAVTKMLLNEYSQLPVMKNERSLVGAVTWKSIARARLRSPDTSLSTAVVKATRMSFGDDLHTVLPTLQNEDFVVVANPTNEITGIVTTADVVALYHDRTLPFLLIGELDQELRRLIEDSVPLDTVRSVCADRGTLASFDEMDMGHYQRVLENPECWAMLDWPLDRVTVIHRIDELRIIRNDIAHFNPDPLPEDTVDKIRHMLDLIRGFRR